VFNKQQNFNKNKKAIFVSSKLSSDKITSHIVVSNNLKKYFNNYSFFVSYDEPIIENNSISNIPILSRVLPLAWITGSDVYVDELDEKYLKSMNLLQQKYKEIYPKAPFQTKLIVKKQIKNKPNPDGAALLFSGGLDSTYSLYKNINRNPNLIIILGIVGTPIGNNFIQSTLKKEFSNFAEREHLKINFIRTNIMEIFDRRIVNHLWNRLKGVHTGDFWYGIGFSLGQIGLTAPLSIEKFNNLIISGSEVLNPKERIPYASYPYTDEKIRWVNLTVAHYNGVNRYDKIFLLRNFMHDYKVRLRVCFFTSKKLVQKNILNCSQCEKCLRTIIPLILIGLDPNDHGFIVDESTFNLIKYLLKSRIIPREIIEVFWKRLQKIVPEDLDRDVYDSKQFFEWFKSFNLDLASKKQDKIAYLYIRSPDSFKHFLEISRIYELFSRLREILFGREISIYVPIDLP
jgi:hypothetical protein